MLESLPPTAAPALEPFQIVLVNPARVAAGLAVMTARWMPVIAGATPSEYADRLVLVDQVVENLDYGRLHARDLVGLSIHTLNAAMAYDMIRALKEHRGCTVVAGGVHASLFPIEALDHGADAVVRGDGDVIWPDVVRDFAAGRLQRTYEGGRVAGSRFVGTPRWDLVNHARYMMATVNTTRGCPETCSFCSVWRTDGVAVRFRTISDTIDEINELYRLGFRLIVLADDNFYASGSRKSIEQQKTQEQRYELMEALATRVPPDVSFFTQTTILTADDERFMRAMRRAKIRGVLIGIESVDEAGLTSVNKRFNKTGDDLVRAVHRLQTNGIYVLGSHIVGLPPDTPDTYDRMLAIANLSRMAFAQFVLYTSFPGTVDYERQQRSTHPMTLRDGQERYWLQRRRPGSNVCHPTMSDVELAKALARLWNGFYSLPAMVRRATGLGLWRPKWLLAYVLFGKFAKAVYFDYGVSADSVRTATPNSITRWIGWVVLRMMKAPPGSSRSKTPAVGTREREGV